MVYNNSDYWLELHIKHLGSLRAVGLSDLSEAHNLNKYKSEMNTLLDVLEVIPKQLGDIKEISLLDVGAGGGYWSEVVYQAFTHMGIHTHVTALDISENALDIIKQRYPSVTTLNEDLKIINPEYFHHQFDLVISFYCLHHLIKHNDFLNALMFSANSVKEGGFLLIMDPILSRPYSEGDIMDFATYKGNGIPRHLYLLDDLMLRQGFKRYTIKPAISFILNGSVEGYSLIDYTITKYTWGALRFLYKNDKLSGLFSRPLLFFDNILKKTGLSFSSSLCVYQRTGCYE